MEWQVEFFNGSVRNEIWKWPAGIRANLVRIVERMSIYGPNLGMPYTRPFGRGLFEIRAKGQEGIGRAFFCMTAGRRIVILHGFIKKTDKTPRKELNLAIRRMHEVK